MPRWVPYSQAECDKIAHMRQTELRQVVATLQEALSAAHEQMRERELAAAEMNRRFVEVLAERDELEQRLDAAQTREQTK